MFVRSALTAVLLLVLATAGASPPVALAAAFPVTKTADTNDGACNADCSLREAIIAANASPGADTITLAADVYTYSIAGPGEDSSSTGDLDVTDDLTITGAGSGITVLNANGVVTGDGAMDVIGSITVAITGLTIENGTAPCCGGGLWNGEADLDLTDVALTNNSAPEGGGFWNGGTATLTNVTISGNTAAERGGGIYSSGTLSLTGTSVSNNTATQFEGGGIHVDGGTADLTGGAVSDNTAGATGGGIRNDAALTVTNTTISGNDAAGDGGGIANRFGSAAITGGAISDNTAAGTGGGIRNDAVLTVTGATINGNDGGSDGGGIYSSTDMAITDSTIADNEADRAGGLFVGGSTTLALTDSTVKDNRATAGSGGGLNSSGTSTITGTTINGNTATLDGGGIWTSPFFGPLTLTSSTVSGNSAAGEGGGIAVGGTTGTFSAGVFNSTVAFNTADSDSDGVGGGGGIANGGPVADLKNTIIARNADPSSPNAPDCVGEFNALGNNLIQDPTCPISGTFITGQDPLLGPLADNGGATQTHALLAGSLAIDAGSDCPPPATDQRGEPRPQGAHCDIGAFESEPGAGQQVLWGDSDCGGDITTRDNQALLRKVLQQAALSQTEPCPDIGSPVPDHIWGDWDCNGDVTTRDNQALLRKILQQAALSQTEPCPDLGAAVAVG